MSTYPGGYDSAIFSDPFPSAYRTHLQHLKLKGLQPKTIDAYARAIRRMGDYFDFAIDKLSPTQLTHYFSDLITTDAPPPQHSKATTNQSHARSQLEDRATVPQKHCACARPKTASHCPKSAAMTQGAPPSYRLSQVNALSRRQDKKDIFCKAKTTVQNRARPTNGLGRGFA